MSETIDQTQWLPRNSPVVNPHRAAKGDLQGRIREDGVITYAEAMDVSILAKLIQTGFLEEHHRWYGLTLLELQNAFYGPLNAKGSAYALLDNLCGVSVTKKHALSMYDDIMRQFKLHRLRIVDQVCNRPYPTSPHGDDLMPAEAKNASREVFELLVRITDEVVEKIKDEIAKGLADA